MMYESQGRVCKICKTLPGSGRLCVDHLHIKGFKKMEPLDKRKYVRGLLCFLCNTGIKVCERTLDPVRNRQFLWGMLEYFTTYPIKGDPV